MLSRPLGKRWILLAGVVVVSLWAFSHFGVRFVASSLYGSAACEAPDEESPAKAREYADCLALRNEVQGAFGDSFGAINALFTGLALAGLVLTLVLHSESARRVAKPFVVPVLDRAEALARVSVRLPNRVAGQVILPIEVILPVRNESAHPALNLSVRLAAIDVPFECLTNADLPVAGGAGTAVVANASVSGAEARRFVTAVSADGLLLSAKLECESVEGVRWRSSVSYLVRVDPNRQGDRDLLNQAIDGPIADADLWGGNAQVDLLFSTVAGSWKYEEIT